MKNTKKALLLAVSLIAMSLCLIFSASALENQGQCGENVFWEYNSATKTLVISGEGKMYNGSEFASSVFAGSDVNDVYVSEGVTYIGSYAFKGATSITKVTLASSVTNIGSSAFRGCSNLSEINLGNNVTTIAPNAFTDTKYYNTSSNWENDVLYLHQYLIAAKKNIHECEVKSNTLLIADMAFNGCTALRTVTIPDTVMHIGSNAFVASGYYNAASNWQNNALYIGKHLISVKPAATSCSLKSDTITVADAAFYNCSKIEKIELPASVLTVGVNAFGYCRALKEIIISDRLMSIDKEAFTFCDALEKITVSDGNACYSSDADGVLYNKNKTIVIKFPAKNMKSSYVMPDTVTRVEDYCFEHAENLIDVKVSDKVNYLGEKAFLNCKKLRAITIPQGVKRIHKYTFSNCEALDNVVLNDHITAIEEGAFYNCTGLKKITLNYNIKTIGKYAFEFAKNLKDVYYIGTKAEWESTKIEICNTYLTDADFHFISKPVVIPSESTTKPDVNSATKPSGGSSSATTSPDTSGNAVKVKKPAKVKITKAKATKKKGILLVWKKVSGAKGYQVTYSTNKKFVKKATKNTLIKKAKTTKTTLKKLKSGKKYFVKVRAYKLANGKKLYGAYSKVKTVRVK